MADEQSTVEYRLVEGFPGYRVGSDGSVWTRKNGRYGFRDKWRLMKSTVCNGYFTVVLSGSRRYVHRLVLEAFVGQIPDEMQETRHLDGNKKNNVLANLMWGTRRENHADMHRHGTARKWALKLATLTENEVRQIGLMAIRGCTRREIAEQFGISTSTVGNIKAGRCWEWVFTEDQLETLKKDARRRRKR